MLTTVQVKVQKRLEKENSALKDRRDRYGGSAVSKNSFLVSLSIITSLYTYHSHVMTKLNEFHIRSIPMSRPLRSQSIMLLLKDVCPCQV